MTSIPIKTNDLIRYSNELYVVKSVTLTEAGPVLEISPVSKSSIIVHGSEIALADSVENFHRAKSIGGIAKPVNKAEINIPKGMSKEQAEKILAKYYTK